MQCSILNSLIVISTRFSQSSNDCAFRSLEIFSNCERTQRNDTEECGAWFHSVLRTTGIVLQTADRQIVVWRSSNAVAGNHNGQHMDLCLHFRSSQLLQLRGFSVRTSRFLSRESSESNRWTDCGMSWRNCFLLEETYGKHTGTAQQSRLQLEGTCGKHKGTAQWSRFHLEETCDEHTGTAHLDRFQMEETCRKPACFAS